jgi:CRISPR-associated exonuclease Cas4
MYADDDLLFISALQHLAFCPRQCALIHLEEIWSDNFLTAEGNVLHEKTHEAGTEYCGDKRVVRSLRLRSLRLGLTGVADVVEFHRHPNGIELPTITGTWRIFPVEYKRGSPKSGDCDIVQLCAQALCLEEMLGTTITEGAIFYGKPRRRQSITFDTRIRNFTEDLASKLHELVANGVTPPAEYSKKCNSCSLLDECKPRTIGSHKSVSRYLGQVLAVPLKEGE